MIVATSAGTLLRDTGDGSFGTTLDTGLNTSAVGIFTDGGQEAAAENRKLFFCNGKNVVQVLSGDGTTTTNLTTPPADWSGANQPSFTLIHEGRLWGGGNANDPHRLYYSRTTDHEDFTGTGSGTLSIFPGEGENLVGAISFKGVIVCWKAPQGVYVIDTIATSVADWKISRLSAAIGGVSTRGAVMIDNDLLFLDDDGNVHLLSSVTEFGNLGTRNLSQIAEMNPFIRDHVNLAQLNRCQAVFYPAKREAHFAVAGLGATTNTRRLVVDFNLQTRPRFRWSDRDTAESMWLRKDSDGIPRLTIGDAGGFVWHLDQDARSKDGGAYNAEFETGQIDFSHLDPQLAAKRKLGDFLELVFEPVGNYEVDVTIKWDGDAVHHVSYQMQETGSLLGTGVLGSFLLGREGVFSIKKRITGSGKRFSCVVKNNRALENFSVARAFLYFRVGSEREA